MTEVIKILEDDRPIKCLSSVGALIDVAMVGIDGVTEIVAYGEPGLHCDLPYFAVKSGDQIKARIPANTVAVHYQMPGEF